MDVNDSPKSNVGLCNMKGPITHLLQEFDVGTVSEIVHSFSRYRGEGGKNAAALQASGGENAGGSALSDRSRYLKGRDISIFFPFSVLLLISLR